MLYYGLIASDVYVSESRFVVRSPQKQSQTNLVGALLQGTGFSRAQDDTYPVIDYIESRDALRELNVGNYVADAYSEHGDVISRFHRWPDGSFESLWKYYGKRIVDIEFDSTSAIAKLQIRAYTAEDAEKINERLLEMSERLINRMNRRAVSDTVTFAQGEVDVAAAKAKDAAAALAAYRRTYTVFDPDRQSALQLQQVTALQTQMLAAQTQLVQLQSISPKNPQIPVLQTNIANLEKQITAATSGVAGGKNSLADKAARVCAHAAGLAICRQATGLGDGSPGECACRCPAQAALSRAPGRAEHARCRHRTEATEEHPRGVRARHHRLGHPRVAARGCARTPRLRVRISCITTRLSSRHCAFSFGSSVPC